MSELSNKYAILMETSGEEYESWYYFIKYEGNEEALNHLQHQFELVRWRIVDYLSTFDLELETLVSEQTAKEFTLIDINPTSRHRKFDGKLQFIDLNFLDTDTNKRRIKKTFKVLGYGKIDNFIDEEDVEELEECDDMSETTSSSDSSDSDYDSSSCESNCEVIEEKKTNVPKARMPSFIKTKKC